MLAQSLTRRTYTRDAYAPLRRTNSRTDTLPVAHSDPQQRFCALPILLKINDLRVQVSRSTACGTRIALSDFQYGREIYTTQRSSGEKRSKTANNARSIAYSVQPTW